MWPFGKGTTKKQKDNESQVQGILGYATTSRIEETIDPHVQLSLMQLRMWGFNDEVDAILPRLPQEARGSIGPLDLVIAPLGHSPSPALAARMRAARSEELSNEQQDRIRSAIAQWLSR